MSPSYLVLIVTRSYLVFSSWRKIRQASACETSCTIFTLVRLAKMICFIILVGLVHVSSKQFEVVFHLIVKDLLLTKVVKHNFFFSHLGLVSWSYNNWRICSKYLLKESSSKLGEIAEMQQNLFFNIITSSTNKSNLILILYKNQFCFVIC